MLLLPPPLLPLPPALVVQASRFRDRGITGGEFVRLSDAELRALAAAAQLPRLLHVLRAWETFSEIDAAGACRAALSPSDGRWGRLLGTQTDSCFLTLPGRRWGRCGPVASCLALVQEPQPIHPVTHPATRPLSSPTPPSCCAAGSRDSAISLSKLVAHLSARGLRSWRCHSRAWCPCHLPPATCHLQPLQPPAESRPRPPAVALHLLFGCCAGTQRWWPWLRG